MGLSANEVYDVKYEHGDPSNTAEQVEKKVGLYFRYGAREVWHVYRNPVHIVVHLPDRTSRTVLEGSLTTALLPGFELGLADLEALIEKY